MGEAGTVGSVRVVAEGVPCVSPSAILVSCTGTGTTEGIV